MRDEIERAIATAAKTVFKVEVQPELTRPDEQFGDYATNVALQLAAKTGQKPREVAEQLAASLKQSLAGQVSEISVAGPGFINFLVADEQLLQAVGSIDANYGSNDLHKGKTVVTEYSDPNPFKVLHAGHLYTSVVGDSIAKLFEAAGANVHRVNFGGDVGLHVAKTMWAILKRLGGADLEKLNAIKPSERASFMADAYVEGTKAYDAEMDLAQEGDFLRPVGDFPKNDILLLNQIIYDYWGKRKFENSAYSFSTIRSHQQIKAEEIYEVYNLCRDWSYDYFEEFYKRLGSGFEKYYPESEVAELGLKTVNEQLKKGVFEESDGAIVFPGDQHDLHTRVFINSEGLPTYEAKDIGLILQKWQDYNFDLSVVITANEIAQYMQVVLKALEQFQPELAKKTVHLTHGVVKLQGGVKMSSRLGNILRATDVLDAAAAANHKLSGKEQPHVVLGAVKYAFLKQGMGGDIVYDPEESVAVQGNSGPYLQYAHARAKSILKKGTVNSEQGTAKDLEAGERSLARKLAEFPEVVERAVTELAPHHVATYLYELAQGFNQFYEKNRVLGDKREALRLQLVQAYAQVLENGLSLLNIEAPARM